MFLAIIVPPARRSRVVLALVLLSFAASYIAGALPVLAAVSSGGADHRPHRGHLPGGGPALPVAEDQERDTSEEGLSMNIWLYILISALVAFLIRATPLVLIRREIRSRTLRSFLYYVPYVTLAVMTFPAIVEATESPLAGLLALVAGGHPGLVRRQPLPGGGGLLSGGVSGGAVPGVISPFK